jgi:L-asparaginase / beta-aspartyl-peptidase
MVKATWSGVAARCAVVVHGGAGAIKEASRASRESGCRAAAEAARLVLKSGGSALDAVQRAVELLEDDPLFNAGTGGSLTSNGHLELDAAIMQGRGLRAGAVCALPAFKNPIAIARRVLDEGKHVLYAAHGAEAFARGQGFAPAAEEEMITSSARERLAQALAGSPGSGGAGHTVGAVALDQSGDVAAATSTGGITGKAPGRVGDSPLLGAGTYADAGWGAAQPPGTARASCAWP